MKSLNLIATAIVFMLVSTTLAYGDNPIDPCDIHIPETCHEELTEKKVNGILSVKKDDLSRNGSSSVLIQDEFIILAGEMSGGGLSSQSNGKCVRNNMSPFNGGKCCSGCVGSNGVCKSCGSPDVIEL